MRCRKARKKIYGYIDGYLDAFEAEKLEAHLSSCDACAKELEAESRTIQLAASLPNRYPSEAAWSKFIPELHRRIELELIRNSRTSSSRSLLSFDNLKFAAALGALILAIFSASFSGFKAVSTAKPRPQPPISQMQFRNRSNTSQTEMAMMTYGSYGYGYDIMLSEESGSGAVLASTGFKQVISKYELEPHVPISISEAIDQSSLVFDSRQIK
jgi:hypothetical protein